MLLSDRTSVKIVLCKICYLLEESFLSKVNFCKIGTKTNFENPSGKNLDLYLNL